MAANLLSSLYHKIYISISDIQKVTEHKRVAKGADMGCELLQGA